MAFLSQQGSRSITVAGFTFDPGAGNIKHLLANPTSATNRCAGFLDMSDGQAGSTAYVVPVGKKLRLIAAKFINQSGGSGGLTPALGYTVGGASPDPSGGGAVPGAIGYLNGQIATVNFAAPPVAGDVLEACVFGNEVDAEDSPFVDTQGLTSGACICELWAEELDV